MLNIVPTELGILSGTEQIAIFSIAMTLEGYVNVFASALNGLFLPKITRMVMTNEDRKEVNYLMIRVGRLQLLVLGLLITGIVVLGKPFIQLWMGDKFIPSYYVSLFLIIPGIITLTQEIAATLLFVVNEMKYRAMLFIVASIISIIIGVILIPTLGAMGAAIGVGTALLLFHVLGMNFVYSWKLKLDMKLYFYSVHIKMIWPIVVSGVISMLIQYIYPVENWISFVVSGLFFVIIYTSLMWGFVMNSEEKGLITNSINKIRK
jgi:O-antigen/teichoic acid export membrane protein